MVQFINITDVHDERLSPFRSLRERDLVGREGLFIAEGRVVLNQVSRTAPGLLRSLLVLDKHLDRIAEITDRLASEMPVYAVSQEVMDAVAGFPIHRGLLGLGRKPKPTGLNELLQSRSEDLRLLVLIGIANHDNMGGLMRNAAAFGVDAVVIDQTCCDPFYRKAIRVSVGASATLPICEIDSKADWISHLRAGEVEVFALTPEGASDLGAVVPPRRWALVLGAEGPGLAPSLLAQCRSLRIRMAGDFDSLNVATTSGIALHHMVNC